MARGGTGAVWQGEGLGRCGKGGTGAVVQGEGLGRWWQG